MADRLPVPVKHIQHWLLVAFRGFCEVVEVIGVPRRRQQAQPPPAAFPGEGENAFYRGLPGDREIDPLGDVLCRTVELIEQGGA